MFKPLTLLLLLMLAAPAPAAPNPKVLKDTNTLLADATDAYERQDYAKAREWYEKAAAGGDVDAQKSLGDIYAQ